tara:strand:- start:239 stop:349 length:111 start_codon:yes stop_codon:yes gene_type:complete
MNMKPNRNKERSAKKIEELPFDMKLSTPYFSRLENE